MIQQKREKNVLCSWHDASAIAQPMDFFEPILQLKYGNEYDSLKEHSWFKKLLESKEGSGIFQLAGLCGREEGSANPNARRLPVIFIDGIEELFFKMDYSHLDEEGRKKLLTGDLMKVPGDKGFGNCLREYLNQNLAAKGLFCGSVKNTGGIEYRATLGNYHYLFYCGNFMMKHFF